MLRAGALTVTIFESSSAHTTYIAINCALNQQSTKHPWLERKKVLTLQERSSFCPPICYDVIFLGTPTAVFNNHKELSVCCVKTEHLHKHLLLQSQQRGYTAISIMLHFITITRPPSSSTDHFTPRQQAKYLLSQWKLKAMLL